MPLDHRVPPAITRSAPEPTLTDRQRPVSGPASRTRPCAQPRLGRAALSVLVLLVAPPRLGRAALGVLVLLVAPPRLGRAALGVLVLLVAPSANRASSCSGSPIAAFVGPRPLPLTTLATFEQP